MKKLLIYSIVLTIVLSGCGKGSYNGELVGVQGRKK